MYAYRIILLQKSNDCAALGDFTFLGNYRGNYCIYFITTVFYGQPFNWLILLSM